MSGESVQPDLAQCATRIPKVWGAKREETSATYGCDGLIGGADEAWFRALDFACSTQIAYRWICQLTVAPYSYDLLDNLGRRSPRRLIQGTDVLRVGDRVMCIFDLVGLTEGVELVLRIRPGLARHLFGDLAISYSVRSTESLAGCRVVVKLIPEEAVGLATRLRLRLLAWGDLLMMRK